MCKIKLFECILFYTSFPLNLICNMTTFRRIGFYLLTLSQGLRVYMSANYLLTCCGTLHYPLSGLNDNIMKNV